ncbi:hypothetical protein B0H10DRAFT_1872472, partial [Mycena sp. CBHHK59/15]
MSGSAPTSATDDLRVVCKCSKKCGGPDGPGRRIAFSTRSLHRRQDAGTASPIGSGFTDFIASVAPPVQQPLQSGSGNAIHRKRRIPLILREEGQVSSQRRRLGFADDPQELPPRMESPPPFEPARNLDGPEHNTPNVPRIPEFEPDPGSLDDQARADLPPTPPIRPPTPPSFDTRTSAIEDINISLKFIAALQNASLENAGLDAALLHQIRNPATSILSVEDPDDRLSINIFLAIGNASEASYTAVRAAILRRNPDYEKMLTYYKVKRLVADLTGVIALEQDMYINSCIGYT